MEIIAIVLLVLFNTGLARKKNFSTAFWGLMTVVGYMVFAGTLGLLYLGITFKGKFDFPAFQAHMEQVKKDPLQVLLITLLGVGGGLLVRFIMERTPPNGPPPERRP